MLIRPAIGDTDPIRYRRPTPDGQFSGNILDEAMRPFRPDWFHEIKHDGYRLIVQHVTSRYGCSRGAALTGRVAIRVMAALKLRARSFVIDDEAVRCH